MSKKYKCIGMENILPVSQLAMFLEMLETPRAHDPYQQTESQEGSRLENEMIPRECGE